MAKRQSTLKKKVSKRQTRKFSKKGGSKKGGSKKGGSKKGGSKKKLVGGIPKQWEKEDIDFYKNQNNARKDVGEKIVKELEQFNIKKLMERFDSKGIMHTPIDNKNINNIIKYAIINQHLPSLLKILKKGKEKGLEINYDAALVTMYTAYRPEWEQREEMNLLEWALVVLGTLFKEAAKVDVDINPENMENNPPGNMFTNVDNDQKIALKTQANKEYSPDPKIPPLSPLIYAIYKDDKILSYYLIRFLIDQGADVNTKDSKNGNTVLMGVLSNTTTVNKEKIMNDLLEKGADVNAKNKEGKTALDVAIIRKGMDFDRYADKHEAIIKILEEHGGKKGEDVEVIEEPLATDEDVNMNESPEEP